MSNPQPVVITLHPGQAIRIELADTDGAFEVHYDTAGYASQLVVAEVENLPDSYGRKGILYCEDWNKSLSNPAVPVEADDAEEDTDLTFAIYSPTSQTYFNREEQAWVHTRVDPCEYCDPVQAHERVAALLKQYGTSEQFEVLRSDQKPW